MLTSPFLQAKTIIENLEAHNYEAYFVGGAVRDLLLGRDVNDIDITTSATPDEVMGLFSSVIPVGIEHGTVIVRQQKKSYEVTTYRHENEDIEKTLEEDLRRRDFTINALAMDKEGHIIDLFQGEKDIQDKKIRAVESPYDRFKEDPLRMLRALRFASELSFSIEETTLEQLKNLGHLIEDVAVERITVEMTKLLLAKELQKGLAYLRTSGLHKYLPVFKERVGLFEKLAEDFSKCHSFGQFIALLHILDRNLPVSSLIKAWKSSNHTRREAEALVEAISEFKEAGLHPMLVYKLNKSYFKQFSSLTSMLFNEEPVNERDLHKINDSLAIHSRDELAFNGHHLMTLFPDLKRGRWISEMLAKIEQEVVTNQLENTYQDIEEWVLCNPPEVN